MVGLDRLIFPSLRGLRLLLLLLSPRLLLLRGFLGLRPAFSLLLGLLLSLPQSRFLLLFRLLLVFGWLLSFLSRFLALLKVYLDLLIIIRGLLLCKGLLVVVFRQL